MKDNALKIGIAELFSKSNPLIEHINNFENLNITSVNSKLSAFFDLALFLGIQDLDKENTDRYNIIITKVCAKINKKRQKSEKFHKFSKKFMSKMVVSGALAMKPPVSETSIVSKIDTTRQKSEGNAQLPKQRKTVEEAIISIITGPELIEISGIKIKKIEDLFDIERIKHDYILKEVPRIYEDLELAMKYFLKNGAKAGNLMGEGRLNRNQSIWLRRYMKKEIADKLNDEISQILATYATTTNSLFLHRGVHFDTREAREKYIEVLRTSGLERKSSSDEAISTTVFENIAVEFAKKGPYGIIVKIDLSKINLKENLCAVKYFGENPDGIFQDMREGEIRVSNRIPPNVIIDIQLVDRE